MEITLYCNDAAIENKALQFSNQFQIPLVVQRLTNQWQLCLFQDRVELAAPDVLRFTPFVLDFEEKKLNKRRQELGAKNSLVKAIGHQTGRSMNIIDMTAGLGRDAFLLAALGHQVTLIERSQILALMLQEALDRAVCSKEIGAIAQRMRLIWADSQQLFKSSSAKANLVSELPEPDIIYIDPMFPERDKTALVKKDMQILQHIIGHGQNDDSLLDLALTKAKKRVVVKRPRIGVFLQDKIPDLQFIGKTQRFDVYLIK